MAYNVKKALSAAALVAAFTACKSEPKRIDPYSDEAVTSAGVRIGAGRSSSEAMPR